MVNLSIKEQLIILQERLNSVFQMTKLLKEYYRLSEKLSDTEYGLYFEVMYSYIARYIVLEFYRLCDNDNDCVSIPKLKKEVFENFESIFPAKQKDIYGMKYCNITKDELRKNCKTIFNKKIKELQLKVKDIRDHSGLAHGQPEVFDKMILFKDCSGMRILFSPLMQMDNPGISMKRKQEDIGITIELIAGGYYRSAVRNLFALLDSEHKKAANTYEGIIKRKQEYKKGIQRSKKISKLVESLDDSWMDIAWEKVNSYYANVVSTNPVEGVIHRNSIVHGDYDSQLIDVDKYAATKLMLLYLNLRIIADYFSNKAEILENLLLYLPSIILYIQHHPDSKGEE